MEWTHRGKLDTGWKVGSFFQERFETFEGESDVIGETFV